MHALMIVCFNKQIEKWITAIIIIHVTVFVMGEDGFTIHSQLALQYSCANKWNDLDWDALYGLPRSVHARGLLLAPAVATASLSPQGWATLMAGPFWGCDDCSQSYGSLGNWP